MAGSNTAAVLESLTPGRLFLGLTISFFASFFIDIALKPSYPKSLPRVGYGDGVIASLRNWIGYLISFRSWVQEGYVKYSKHGRAFIVPSTASRPQELVVPPAQTMWMLEQPDRVLSTHDAHNDILYSEYNFLGKRFSDDTFHIRVMHKSLARHLVPLLPAIQEEVNAAVDQAFGTDTDEWRELNLWDAWLGVVPRVTNRILVGKGVCRNEVFLGRMVKFVDDVVRNSFILNMFPKILHPVVGNTLKYPNWRNWRESHKIIGPVIQQRLDDMARKQGGDPAYHGWEAPEDFITWTIRLAEAEGRPFELQPTSISKRILPIEFAAIHTTVLTGHSALLDLLSADPARCYLENIRDETARVFREEGGRWTKAGLARLYRTDSALRESMRLSNFVTSPLKRKVVAPGGITNPAEGWHVPRGGFLALNLDGPHHDGDFFERPHRYDAFRYSQIREEYAARPPEEKSTDESLRVSKLGMVTTSDVHLAFGHGRHACPGRFFVAFELKMILAYLLEHYDFKPLDKRPKPQWIGQTIIPPLDAKIFVKRKRDVP